jgi:hypothetical protein
VTLHGRKPIETLDIVATEKAYFEAETTRPNVLQCYF